MLRELTKPNPELPNLALDCDDVLFPFIRGLIAFTNSEHGTDLCYEDFRVYQLDLTFKLSKPQLESLLFKYYFHHSFDRQLPIPESVKMVRTLAKKYNLYIVTAREYILEAKTLKWAKQHFPQINGVHLAHNVHALSGTHPETKPEICHKLHVKAIVEDALHHANACAEVGIPSILIQKPWNDGDTHDLVTRVEDYQQISSIL